MLDKQNLDQQDKYQEKLGIGDFDKHEKLFESVVYADTSTCCATGTCD